jgi:hypothetical protein
MKTYDEAYFQMVATSATFEDYPIFRIMAGDLKRDIKK